MRKVVDIFSRSTPKSTKTEKPYLVPLSYRLDRMSMCDIVPDYKSFVEGFNKRAEKFPVEILDMGEFFWVTFLPGFVPLTLEELHDNNLYGHPVLERYYTPSPDYETIDIWNGQGKFGTMCYLKNSQYTDIDIGEEVPGRIFEEGRFPLGYVITSPFVLVDDIVTETQLGLDLAVKYKRFSPDPISFSA